LADHVYDLSAFVSHSRLVGAVYSIAVNWAFDTILLQNTLIAYSAIPALKRALPNARIMDFIHSLDERWDVIAATAAISHEVDVRVVISEAARKRLLQAGIEENRIRLIRNGVDLQKFQPSIRPATDGISRILFAGLLFYGNTQANSALSSLGMARKNPHSAGDWHARVSLTCSI
jgi:glycosyltransferase involved in cell wall biosynthesis